MEELLGICKKRSLESKQEDRKAGRFGSLHSFFSVTPEKKIRIYESSPDQFIIIDYSEFEFNYHVVEVPLFTRSQGRMKQYKLNLSRL